MGNERLSVWEKQLEKPLIYRTVQTFFPLLFTTSMTYLHRTFHKQIPTGQYHPDTESGTTECFSDCVLIWPNISSICIERMEVPIQSYDQTASLINTLSKCRIWRSDAKLQNNTTYEKAL